MEPIRVMLADDSRELCDLLSDYLDSEDDMCVVGVAHNGAEALEALESVVADVLILDMIMPYMDGIDVLDRLASANLRSRPRTIVLSALGQTDLVKSAARAGADYFMLKPIDLVALADRIRTQARVDRSTVSKGVPDSGKAYLETTRILRDIGIPANMKGYQYLRDAVMMVAEAPARLRGITKELYPSIAERYRTSPSGVERAIRHAIEIAWTRGNITGIDSVFGNSVDKHSGRPTNSEFVATIVDGLLAQMGSGE